MLHRKDEELRKSVAHYQRARGAELGITLASQKVDEKKQRDIGIALVAGGFIGRRLYNCRRCAALPEGNGGACRQKEGRLPAKRERQPEYAEARH